MTASSSIRTCPKCRARSKPGHRFCSKCGTALQASPPAEPSRGRSGAIIKGLAGLAILLAILAAIGRALPNDDPATAPRATVSAQQRDATSAPDSEPTTPPIARSQSGNPTSLPALPPAESGCAAFDAWEWAQLVYESAPSTYAARLDPDADGIACPELPRGAPPAFWTDRLPAGSTLAAIERVIDGDTFDLAVAGQSTRVRIYRADTPEVYPGVECGGIDATAIARDLLWSSDTPGQVWVESVGQLDRHGRTLAYLWFTRQGRPYLLNHALIATGWAEDIDYGDAFDPYDRQLVAAERFAVDHQLGVWSSCGGFGVTASLSLPTQAPAMNVASDCHPNYSPCVPNVPYDLDCRDVRFRVQIIGGADPYRLDNDDPDLIGCESW